MADVTFNQLSELTSLASDDVFAVYDASEVEEPTKKVTYTTLAGAVAALAGAGFTPSTQNTTLSIPTTAGGTMYQLTASATAVLTLPDSTTMASSKPIAMYVSYWETNALYNIRTSNTTTILIVGDALSSNLFIGQGDYAILYPDTGTNQWYAQVHRSIFYREVSSITSLNYSSTINPQYVFSGDAFIRMNNTTGTQTVTLPTLAEAALTDYWIYANQRICIQYGATGGTLTVARSGTNTIDGATSKSTTTQHSSLILTPRYNGGSVFWQIVGQTGTWT